MSRVFIIIQARMTSTRLPKKVMLPLCGKSVLGVLIERLSCFKEDVIIATTNDGTQTPIVEECRHYGVNCFEGDCDNVLERYYQAAIFFGAKEEDWVVRITSDCPFCDPVVINGLINLVKGQSDTYGYVDIHTSYPRGMDGEIFPFSLLTKAFREAQTPYEKEHVTPYIKNIASQKIPLVGKGKDAHYRLTLDTPEDYEMIVTLYEALGCNSLVSYEDMIKTLHDNPKIGMINGHIEQKTS